MKKILLCLLLIGCAAEKPLSETISENAVNATVTLENSLSVECKTQSIVGQLAVIKTEIRAAAKSCEVEKNTLENEKLKWKVGFLGLLVLIGLYVVRKVLK